MLLVRRHTPVFTRPIEESSRGPLIVWIVTLSFGNVMLIARQKPDATNVAGLRTWNSLGRFVKRGEKGISFSQPCSEKREPSTNPPRRTSKKGPQQPACRQFAPRQ